ncbi:ATP-binding protein [Kamptonema cortianum]|nr:ATP-binding protein [Kamptonema cortianum]
MPSFPSLTPYRILNLATFTRLDELLKQTAQTWEQEAILLTEALLLTHLPLPSVQQSRFCQQTDWFTLLASERFSVLLVGKFVSELVKDNPQESSVKTSLLFDADEIAQFLSILSESSISDPQVTQALARAVRLVQPNDPHYQSAFTLGLAEFLTQSDASPPDPALFKVPTLPENRAANYRATEIVLRQRLQQERLINQVVTQIRQSLQLPAILSTAVEQVRHFLQADRMLIYQFYPTATKATESTVLDGQVTYEARVSDRLQSALRLTEGGECFTHVSNPYEKYRQGSIQAVEDVEVSYGNVKCFLELMRRYQVRAKLIVPIVVQEELWGLLIAQQCGEPRHWLDSEKFFLRQIAEHLAIAIYQAELYAQLQQQKQYLEQRVSERTSELRDALLGAQAANRAKSEFLAAMSHELRTPLTCVIGMSATLLRLPFGEGSLSVQKQHDYLQTIHDSGKHLLELINDILELSQVESGKAILNVTSFSLAKLVAGCRQSLKPKADLTQVALSVEANIAPNEDVFRADQRRVEQILLNLLSNAVKFTPAGGEVTVRVWREGNHAVFQVEDTGIGIPEEQRSLLFQKFQQLDTSYHRVYEGMGLGLALTKQLVELHSGSIEVESTVDVGSIFTVRLPSQPLAAEGQNLEMAGKSGHSSLGRLVLIEHHEETAWAICDLLTAAGYQVVWLVEGTAAIAQIEILQPLVVITAAQLPGIDGYEIIQQLRSLATTCSIKVLLLADPLSREMTSQKQTYQADRTLSKPIQPEILLQTITHLVNTSTANELT